MLKNKFQYKYSNNVTNNTSCLKLMSKENKLSSGS